MLIKTGHPHIQEELNKILAITNTLPKNSVVVDAGANIGLVAIPIAQQIKKQQGVVYAFEAQRMMSYALGGAAALNDLTNLHVHHKAVGANEGKVAINIPDYNQAQDFGLFSLKDKENSSNIHTDNSAPVEEIDIITIDSLNLSRLDFFKIDVEGMEIDVLKGAKKTIQQYQPWCWIEHWKTNIDAIKAEFSELDYTFYIMDQLNMLCVSKEKLAQSPITINAKTC